MPDANPLSSILAEPFAPDLPTLWAYLEHHAGAKPNAQAVIDGQTRWTWAMLQARASEYADGLVRYGAGQGDTIAMLSHSNAEFLACFLGTVRIGATWLGLNPKHTDEELLYVLGQAKPKLIIGYRTLADRNYETALSHDALFLDDTAARSAFFASAEPVEWPTEDASQPAFMVFTSGSSGQPKAALLSQYGLIQAAQNRIRAWQHDGWRTLVNLPINHIGAVGDLCCTVLLAGGAYAFMERFDAAGSLDMIEREKLTLWFQVPTQLQLSLATEQAETADLSSLKAVVWSGAPASLGLVEELRRRFPGMLATDYSMTESIGAISMTPLMNDLDTLTKTAGWPVPGRNVRLCADEICIQDDTIFSGYLNAPNTDAFDANGAFKTGDLGKLDEAGRLTITGRAKDMFKSGGYNVYPREVEQVLEGHEAVAMAAVVAAKDPVFGEVGHAYILPSRAAQPTDQMLSDFARTKLANYKVPKKITISADLPLLPIGKIDKKALKASVRS